MRKIGKTNFVRKVLEECESLEELRDAEKAWIDYYNALTDPTVYVVYKDVPSDKDALADYYTQFTSDERAILGEKLSLVKQRGRRAHGKRVGWSKRLQTYWDSYTPEEKKTARKWHVPPRENYIGSRNPNAKPVRIVFEDGKEEYYDCLKDFYNKYKHTNQYRYTTLKDIAARKRKTFSNLYGIIIYYHDGF